MGRLQEEQKYHDGWIDAQQMIIDAWDEALTDTVGRTEAFERFSEVIEELRKDIESE